MQSSIGTVEAERINTVIIGGGQAGLSVAYHLAKRGRAFVILERHARIGDSWRTRWDSLRLFSSARFDGLVGMPFPAPRRSFPTKNEMADYLEAYAVHFKFPVRTGTAVDRVWRDGDRYLVQAGDQLIETENVVIAMASYQAPRIPAFASSLSTDIVQMHSTGYRNLAQLRAGAVLIVGSGNSGAEIGAEIARSGRPTFISGRSTGEVPFNPNTAIAHRVLTPLLFRIVFHRVLTVDTPMGRKIRPKMIGVGTPLIRTKERDLLAAGATRVPRTVGVRDGKPVIDDGRVLDVANVIWCTGFHPGLSWLDLPIFDSAGEPRQKRGIVLSEPGVFFVGQHFQYAMSSTMIHGVGRDAEFIASEVMARLPAPVINPGVLSNRQTRASQSRTPGAVAGT
ncbi:MAG: FAD-dependent oxidoreductase [Gemmatimonadota bacterium]